MATFIKKYKETGDFEQAPRSGRPRLSTAAQDDVLEQIALKNRKKSAAELNKLWKKATRNSVKVGRKTVNNRLLEKDLPARTPRQKPLKTKRMKEKRLQFANDHLDWSVEDWEGIAFSDETWIQLRENGRLQFVRRRPGEAFLPECVSTKVKHDVKVMIFGAITPSAKSQLIFVDGTVNAARYQQILEKVKIVDFLKNGRNSRQLMEDGAPAHRAATTKRWHADRGITLFPGWPGNSPDLNPIENLWSQMKDMQREERATSVSGLKRIAQKVWGKVSRDYLEKLYESMPRRMQAVIDAQGGHTKY